MAIEVKGKPRLDPRDFAGLEAIAELPGIRRHVTAFLGDRPLQTSNGIDGLPAAAFLGELAEGRL